MARYKPYMLPPSKLLRNYVISTLRTNGSTLYMTPNGVVESRENWPEDVEGAGELQDTPAPVPPGWTAL